MTQNPSSGSDENRPPLPSRVQPNSQDCRARDAGFGGYVDCLVPPERNCSYALPFGESYLCMHPARADIVARTRTVPPEFNL